MLPHPPLPHGPTRAGHRAPLEQPTTDFPNRQAVLADPGKDLTDHARCVWDDLLAGLATPLVRGHSMVPVGGAAEHVPRSDAGRMARATPRTLEELGTLVLSDPPLPLQPQGVFRALSQGPVAEPALDASASARIDQQHLIGLLAGQAIRRGPREPVHPARCHHIAQTL